MILNSLVSYYEAQAKKGVLLRPGWDKVRVSYAIYLDSDGSIREIVSLKKEETRGKKSVLVPQILNAPEQVVRSSGIRPNFMWDKAAFLLGYSESDKRARAEFDAAKELHLRILGGVDSDAARTLCRYFEKHDPESVSRMRIPETVLSDFEKGAILTFADSDGRFIMDDPEVARAWDMHRGNDVDAVKGRCLVTGNEDTIVPIHGKIKGVYGAQSSGPNLISFNIPASASYGKDGAQGLNAPVGRYAMYAYTSALNYLLRERHCTRIGDTTLVRWTIDADEESEDFFDKFLFGDDADATLRTVTEKISRGLPIGIDDEKLSKPFCILGISPNVARLSVRFFYRDTFGKFVKNIAAHYERLEIVGVDRYPRPELLMLETVPPNVKDRSNDVSPLLTGSLLSAIINDRRYPELLYDAVMTRIRAEHSVTPLKAAIIKAYLIKNTNNEKYGEVLTVALNEESTERAYVLGRLFAALEDAQYHANGSSNLKETYLTSACATPRNVFPGMIQTATHHIAKSENIADEKLIGSLIDKLDGGVPFPSRLGSEEQGLFLLGYYHQVQKKFRDIKEAKKNKEA